MYLVTEQVEGNNKVRDSIGGYPVLPQGYDWPTCPETNKEMVLFFQLDIPSNIGVGENRHLSIFMSPEINEIPSFDYFANGSSLPENFWIHREKHFKVYFFNGEGAISEKADQYLQHKVLKLSEAGTIGDNIKIGGSPDWLQDAEIPVGSKGEEFRFLLQIPEGFGFKQKSGAPEQPDSFSVSEYCLFLGNQIYIYVTNEIEDPEAVWLVVQN